MYHRMIQDQQSNPLLPGYSFNAYLVAGMTPDFGRWATGLFNRPPRWHEGLYSESDG